MSFIKNQQLLSIFVQAKRKAKCKPEATNTVASTCEVERMRHYDRVGEVDYPETKREMRCVRT